jgi:predicted acyltransferase
MRYFELKPLLSETERVVSVDALRGFDFVWILCGDSAVRALGSVLHNRGGLVGRRHRRRAQHAKAVGRLPLLRFYLSVVPLHHGRRHCTLAVAACRSTGQRCRLRTYSAPRDPLVCPRVDLLWRHSGHWSDIRFVGVLQRIAICYGVAAVLFLNFGWRGLTLVTAGLLLGYWGLMTFMPVPGIGAGSFAPDANLANWIDTQYLPGRMWDITRDPEGLLSTLPAIASCLLGVLSGLILREKTFVPVQKSLILMGGGLLLAAAGYVWALQFPIIKSIWTSSFVLVAGGYSAFALAAMHQIVDVWGIKRWATAFVWIGANAITLYMLNNLMEFYKLAVRLTGGDFAHFLDQTFGRGTGWLVTSLTGIALVLLLARFLYQRKIFIRV